MEFRKSRLFGLAVSTLFVFISLTAIDFTVHKMLYHYGLIFDYAWADFYWAALTLTFLSISALSLFVYWLRGENKLIAILIFTTIFGLYLAGLLDVLWFVFLWCSPFNYTYLNGPWTWTPYYRLFGIDWRFEHQFLLLAGVIFIFSILWTRVKHLH